MHGASSRIASKSATGGSAAASCCTTIGPVSAIRARFVTRRPQRSADGSPATIRARSRARNESSAVFPPGAAHRSATSSPARGASAWAAVALEAPCGKAYPKTTSGSVPAPGSGAAPAATRRWCGAQAKVSTARPRAASAAPSAAGVVRPGWTSRSTGAGGSSAARNAAGSSTIAS